MIAEDEDSLICDMAQYYAVLDYKSLPLYLFATLAAGLPEDSRIMRKITKTNISKAELMLAGIYDNFNMYLYSMTADAKHGTNKPDSIVGKWLGKDEEKKVVGFNNAETFERTRMKILGGIKHG